ncbi:MULTISPECIES: nucleotidyltransferase family protein [Microbacterium]|uniref:nucleotidyltransferase family protein n=1 Tax=Microbacterium TaxID=33882 RepID=UPI00217DA0E4|nr:MULTISPECIES: nucleotidyltransferase family protein [Microbacterium]UWF77900.1 hypothetical protein JSY13_02220 [Microbacterium neungamense]WCM56077.1 hypothetical protein JRG78_02265 [Microbacterium sp. EF45047]
MEAPGTSAIPLGVRLQFARASVQVIAERSGIRLLHIKGDTVDPSIRSHVRAGSDVDVLIDPVAVPRMHAELVRHGWRVYSTFLDGSPFGHAQTYHHPDWGYLDLHRRFPGIRLPDRRAFEVLWAGHGVHDAVGVPCAVPSLDVQVVLLMLNAARDVRAVGAEGRRVWQAQSPEERARRQALIRELRAEVPFAVTMGELDRLRGRREHLLWKTIAEGGSRGAEWWGRVLAARNPLEAMQTLLRAPLANRSMLAHKLGRDPTALEMATATLRRFGAGIRSLVGRRG